MTETSGEAQPDSALMRSQLTVAQETLRAIRHGEVDALVVADGTPGEQVFTLSSADRPYRIFVESMRDGAATVSQSGIVLYANQSLADILGVPRSRIVGASLTSFLPPNYHGTLSGPPSEVPSSADLEVLTAGHQPTWVRVGASMLQVGDEQMLCLTVTDLTRSRLDQAALDSAHQQSLLALRTRSQFVANMSHEIRTPLNGVLGMAGLLLATELTEEQREYADGVRASGDALMSVVNQILDFSKLDADGTQAANVPFAPVALLEESCLLVAATAQGKGVELLSDVPDELPLLVSGDYNRVRQVLTNLMGNAVKFTSAGYVCTTVSADSDFGSADEPVTRQLRFEVSDTGIGISVAAQSRIFESFVQADDTTTREYGGTGLGLAICRELVELMDGEIGVDSRPGRGSTFWFTVRVEVSPQQPAAAARPSLAPARVLLVDDSAMARQVLERQLASWGLTSVSVASAAAALELLVAPPSDGGRGGPARGERRGDAGPVDHQPRFDLVLVDSDMPGVGGIAFTRALRAQPGQTPGAVDEWRLPVVLLLTDQRVRIEGRAAGVDFFVSKPVRQGQLYNGLVSALDLPRRRGHSPSVVPGAASATRATTPKAQPRTGRDTTSALDQRRVLLAEDNRINQLVAVRLLQKRGYEVDVAVNGRLAVDMHSQNPYLAIFMDCQMPVLDGYQATWEIRRREAGDTHVPIVAMTANTGKGDREKCLAAGMDDYLGKPLSFAALDESITRTLPQEAHDPSASGAIVDRGTHVASSAVLFDPAPTADLCLGDSQLLQQLLTSFREQLEEALDKIDRALRRRDHHALLTEVHSLKGSSGAVGAMRLFELSDAIYQTCRAGALSGIAELVGQLREAAELTLSVLPPAESTIPG